MFLMSFTEYWSTFFHTYDITTEVVMIMLLIVLNTIIAFSRPEKTYMMNIFYWGETCAFITMFMHILMLGATIDMGITHNAVFVNVFYVLFCISLVLTFDFVLFYLNNLSYRRREQRKYTIAMLVIFSAICHLILVRPLFRGDMLVYANGHYVLTRSSDVYIVASICCVAMATAIMISNRHHISRVVARGAILFLPFELIGVIAQFYFPTAYFVCATFTTPFLIFYIMHHVAKYDEVTGCQGFSSYRNHLKRLLNSRKEFVVFSVVSPMLMKSDIAESSDKIVYLYNHLSRQVERIDSSIRVYGLSSFNYKIVCPAEDEKKADRIVEQLFKLFTTPVQIRDSEFSSSMNILISRRYPEITDVDEYLNLLNYKARKFSDRGFIQTLTVGAEDALRFKRRLFVEKNLNEIKQSDNLDDERIQLYIQPIYSIKEDDFRTGESLVRMQINGEMVYPDEFIPLSEEIGLIHTFTRIMLHKAAKQTVLMEENCDFDALTVNVSTMELTNPNVHREILRIIKEAGAKPERIRLEITESTSITDYETVIANIRKLSEKGISFYLDDFGTGYSNLDRVIGIPFKTIKFDKNFMLKAMEDQKSRELFLMLAQFCKANGYSTVVEGVETLPQKDFVEKAGFDYIQGYLYSRPLPVEQAMKFYR